MARTIKLDWINAGELASQAEANINEQYAVYHEAYHASSDEDKETIRHQFRTGYIMDRAGIDQEWAEEIVKAGKGKNEPEDNRRLVNAAQTAFKRFVIDSADERRTKRQGAAKRSPFQEFVTAMTKKADGLTKVRQAAFLRDLKALCEQYGIKV